MKTTIRKESKQVFTNAVIPTGNKWRPIENTEHSIVETGPNGQAMNWIAEAIHASKEMICICSFIMDSNLVVEALQSAAERGVKVFVLGSASAKLQDEIEEEERPHRKSYELLLTEVFQSRFLFRSAEYLHAKFILIDPRTKGTGFVTTCNFTQKAFTENPELVVRLEHHQIQELFQIFVYHFWEHATHEQGRSKDFSAVRPFGVFPPPVIQDMLLTSPLESICNLKSSLRVAIESAKTNIYLSTFSIDEQFELTKIIERKLQEGIQVTIFTRCLPKQVELLFRLQKAGATVMIHPLLHAKFLVVDGLEGFVFTANFKSQGMDSGMEVGLKLGSRQIKELMGIVDSWRNGFGAFLESTVSIQNAPQKFEIFRNGNRESVQIESLVKKTEQKPISTLKDLRQAMSDLDKVRVPDRALILEYMLELKGPKVPSVDFEEEELASSIYRIQWTDGKKEKVGLLLKLGYSSERLSSIPVENNHWPVYFDS